MSVATVLVVDDDPQLRRVLRTTLIEHGYEATDARNGEEAVERLREEKPSLIILDMNMPGMNGVETCRTIRSTSTVPIIMLTVRDSEADKIEALDAGADDYVTKPFSAPELMARVRSALRRSAHSGERLPILKLGSVTVDLTARTATNAEGPLHLTPLEYRVLECLARNAGMIVTQRRLINEAWGADRQGDARGLRSYIKMIRQKIEPNPGQPRFLVTETGVGYRLRPDDD